MFQVIVTLAAIGLLLYGINTYLPMHPSIKRLINIVGAVCIAYYLLVVFGVIDYVNTVPIPKLH